MGLLQIKYSDPEIPIKIEPKTIKNHVLCIEPHYTRRPTHPILQEIIED